MRAGIYFQEITHSARHEALTSGKDFSAVGHDAGLAEPGEMVVDGEFRRVAERV